MPAAERYEVGFEIPFSKHGTAGLCDISSAAAKQQLTPRDSV